jgi:hypothetical protein
MPKNVGGNVGQSGGGGDLGNGLIQVFVGEPVALRNDGRPTTELTELLQGRHGSAVQGNGPCVSVLGVGVEDGDGLPLKIDVLPCQRELLRFKRMPVPTQSTIAERLVRGMGQELAQLRFCEKADTST